MHVETLIKFYFEIPSGPSRMVFDITIELNFKQFPLIFEVAMAIVKSHIKMMSRISGTFNLNLAVKHC